MGASSSAGSEQVITLLRFIARRLRNGRLAAHPMVRRVLMLAAVIGWVNKRFSASTQRISLKKGETLRVEVIPPGKPRT